MKTTLHHTLILFLLFLFFQETARAQMDQSPMLTWEEFLNEYAAETAPKDQTEDETSGGLSETEIDQLESLATYPLEINRATREDFMQLPFLDEGQIHSLLDYRAAKRGFKAMGELMLLRDFDFRTRRWMTLFMRCDSAYHDLHPYVTTRSTDRPLPRKHNLNEEHHEIISRLDVPLYRREGNNPQKERGETNYFTGPPLRHLLRYRYVSGQQAKWGLTLEKDEGEPVAKQGFYPYDHISAYFYLHPWRKHWEIVMGDYEVRSGRGLIAGRQMFGGSSSFASQRKIRTALTLRPHTSAAEYGFFRGGAMVWTMGAFRLAGYASLRKLDARTENGTVRTILQTGLHRTLREIERRRNLRCLTGGMAAEWENDHAGVTLHALTSHYALPLEPDDRLYNRDLFRGSTITNLSASWHLQRSIFNIGGEYAMDQGGHIALEQILIYTPSKKLTTNLQLRHFSPAFTSPYGQALQQGSRVRNEQGALIGATFRPNMDWLFTSSLDIFRFIHPTYSSVLPHAKGVEWAVTANGYVGKRNTLQVNYRLKSRERTISGYELLEWRTTQRIIVGYTAVRRAWKITPMLAASFASRQTGRRDWGILLGQRTAWNKGRHWKWRLLTVWFKTTDFASAIYVQKPDLLQSGLASAFAHHGTHLSTTLSYAPTEHLSAGVRLAMLRYFNQCSQSTGVMRINSPWKNDVALLVKYAF